MNNIPIAQLFLLIILSGQTFAQFSDDFSDGDFTQNPPWTGDTNNFVVNAGGALQLLAPATAGKSLLITESRVNKNARWTFRIQMNFNPSSSNYADVYLMTDQADLSSYLNGYFVRIGNTQDEVSLYRKDGTATTKIIDGADGRVNLSAVTMNIQVTKNENSIWELLVDPELDDIYHSEGTITDSTYFYSAYFGIVCTYTSTRSDKFFFDDFAITGDVFSDQAPPMVELLELVGDSILTVHFNEAVEPSSATKTAHYSLDHQIGQPVTVVLEDEQTVMLYLPESLMDAGMYTLTIDGVEDIFGNTTDNTTHTFSYSPPYIAGFGDLLITEIMADPSPEVGLPLWEYLEIYNPHDVPLTLSGLTLIVGDDTTALPMISISGREYLILCQSAAVTDLAEFGKTITIPGWPTLNNEGETIQLLNSKNQLVFSVEYNATTYKSIEKDDGGWSLEMIDPHFPCKGDENWMASADNSGGTPGRQNASSAALTDFTKPEIHSIIGVNEYSIHVKFSEKLYPEDPPVSGILLTPSPGIAAVTIDMPIHDTWQIITESALTPGTNYHVTIANVADCAGNASDALAGTFMLTKPADSLDILLNEILFNPPSGGVDFVEIYNNSEKTINLKDWALSNSSKGIITSDHYAISPGQFLAITSNVATLRNYYPNASQIQWLQAASLPAFNDDEGEVQLLDPHGKTIDSFRYSEDMHSIFLKDDEGVSLERIEYSGPSNEASNWQSAAESAGFATPGMVNSQHQSNARNDEVISIEPEVFDPGSGNSDSYTMIKCRFPEPGNMASISIIDPAGRKVRTIARQQSIGAEEEFKWEGDNDTGQEVRIGPYVVYLEIYNADGSRKIYRKRVVVAGRF